MEPDMKILLLSLMCNLFSIGTAASNGLTTITECLCPGYNVIYQCTITGGAFTVWGGTAFQNQCAGEAITLRNSDFGSISSPAVGVCNNRRITGRGISQENNCYTSQLNVTFSEDFVGRTVTCGVDDGSLTFVGSTTLATSTRPLMPPNNFSMNVAPNSITFIWDHVLHNCPGIYYNITSMNNCGMCPPGTETSQITCSDFFIPKNGINCTLMIQTVICQGTDVAVGGNTASVTLFLKVPDAPDLKIIPYYQDGRVLMGLNISFSKNRFSLSDSVDGSPFSFTITYTDTTGRRCGLPTTILTNSTSCVGELCSYYYSDICTSTQINVTAFGSNVLGDGIGSTKMIDYQNSFVVIDTTLAPNSKKIICSFRVSDPTTQKTCEISIANGINCQSALKGSNNNTASLGNTVSINLDDLIRDVDEGNRFCYNLTARDGTEQVVIQSTIIFIEITAVENTGSGPAIVSIVVVLITLVVIVIVLLIFYIVRPKDVTKYSRLAKVQKGYNIPMEEFGKAQFPNYDHKSGHGFSKAEEHDRISPSTAIIARRDSEDPEYQVYKAGYAIRWIFVDSDGYIRSSDKRIRGYRKGWSVFMHSNKTLSEGDEFLYCEANIRGYARNLKEKQDSMPEGVKEVQQWYYLYVFTQGNSMATCHYTRILRSQSIGELIKTGVTQKKIYHEEYIAEKESKIPDVTVNVMAMRDDGKIFEDSQKKLLTAEKTSYDPAKNIYHPPKGWKHLFFQSQGFRVLKDGDKLLFCDPDLLLVHARFYIIEVNTDITLIELISVELETEENITEELKAGHIYLEKTPAEIKNDDKFMALDKDNKLCTGSGVNQLQLLQCEDYKEVWKYVFVQVDDDVLLKDGTRVLYCSYKPKEDSTEM